MDALCAAIPMARALFRAADAGAASTLHVSAPPRSAVLSLEHGALQEAHGLPAEPLGDTLLASGELDAARHFQALKAADPHERVGRWLVSVGVASEAAVRKALEAQLEARVLELLRLRGAELRWMPGRPVRASGLRVSVPLVPSVYHGLLGLAAELPPHVLAARAGRGVQGLTRLGSWLAGKLPASERTLTALLAGDPEPALWPARTALRAIGAIADGRGEIDGYSLLLRKRRELKRRASARRLLDLPESARPELGRGAFRKLVQKLHPDRFHAAEPGLSALSNEVMCALVSAEAELSAQAGRRVGAGA